MKVLIVEDEVVTSMLYERQLYNHGIKEVKIAAEAEEAIRIYQDFYPDYILMDINLASQMDGIETAEEIIKLGQPKIIFITGYDSENYRLRIAKLNPLAYFVKPIKVEQLFTYLK